MDSDYEYFKKKILKKSGVDLNAYKTRQMQRRIITLSAKLGCKSLRQYYRFLEKNQKRYEEFLEYITINFSEFFRDPERFKELEGKIFPEILRKTPNPRIWSAGCATGEEAYSLAIILYEKSPQSINRILATDIDKGALKKAKIGLYDENHIRNVGKERLRKYFLKIGENYKIWDEIKKRVKFKEIDLLKDDFPQGFFHLIVCRNVIIYFENSAKEMLMDKFRLALKKGGFFFCGGTERLFDLDRMGFECVGTCLYRKIQEMGG
ncbi:protein-glutamate O-methyltransferase CheR [Candidatus Aerophobetes bacterium]|nr:protein-glutamate O-methyltransferase CheR [Candidatus Aerophobetes bacterium]